MDQPASIGALPVAVARYCEIDVAYLPGVAMRRMADLHPGNAKTDARDAYVIAEAARTMPHTLRRVDRGDDALADLEVIVAFDDDLKSEVTRVTNRIHGSTPPWNAPSDHACTTKPSWNSSPVSAGSPGYAPPDGDACSQSHARARRVPTPGSSRRS